MSLNRLKASADTPSSLEFPIYKYKLHELATKRDEELLSEQAKIQVEIHVNRIVNRIIEAAEMGKSQFIYNDKHGFSGYCYLQKNLYSSTGLVIGTSFGTTVRKFIIPDIVVELKKKFPDSFITIDPLNTYILIDWS